MAVAADGDPGLWPVPPDATDQAAQVTAHLGARGRFAPGRNSTATGSSPFVDMDRQALVVMCVEQRDSESC
jgi:hypothetical protein